MPPFALSLTHALAEYGQIKRWWATRASVRLLRLSRPVRVDPKFQSFMTEYVRPR